jgi:hypothetical protein
MLAAAVACMRSLPPIQQFVLACHYHQEISLEGIADRLRLPLEQVTEAHDAAVIAVHAALAAQTHGHRRQKGARSPRAWSKRSGT